MKITKRIIAVFLSVFIMAAIPFNAFATKIVDTIDLTVDVKPGTIIENYEEYITLNTDGLAFFEEFYIYKIYEEESYYPSTDYFEPGSTYELIIILDVAEGYVFADREADFKSVTVNGEEVYFESYFNEEYMESECYAVFATVETDGVLTEIDLTVNPVAGYLIEDYYRYVKINSLGVEFEEILDNGVNVTDAFGGNPFNYFVEEEYSLEICLTPAPGCEFAKDDEGNILLESVTVNGEDIEYDAHIESNRGYFEYVIIKMNVTPTEKTVITVIDLTVETDLKGYDVENYNEYITIETQGVSFDNYDPNAVYACNSDYEEVYTFEGGDYYWLFMNFITEEGYFFDPDGVLITINGEEYAYIGYNTYEPENGITVEYIYTEYMTDFAGNFFDRIILWFKDIFELLFGWMVI